jgi:hypothetical protein
VPNFLVEEVVEVVRVWRWLGCGGGLFPENPILPTPYSKLISGGCGGG